MLNCVSATQTLRQRRQKTMRVTLSGTLRPGVAVKDIISGLIARIGTNGAVGHAVEDAGPGIATLSMEARMTLCNMSIEAGARVGMVAPDDVTFAYLKGRPLAPEGADWDRAVAHRKTLPTDGGAVFDREVELDIGALSPQVSWGTNPGETAAIDGQVPDPALETDPVKRAKMERSLRHMGLAPGVAFKDIAIDRVFIGSCTNGRIEDLRSAAAVVAGRQIAAGVEGIVVPGSATVRLTAEAEGLDRIFRAAGFEWRESGCSMCVAMNDDRLSPGQRCASTSNRNFEGRQGQGGRTHSMSPAMAAAAAVTGRLTDVRDIVGNDRGCRLMEKFTRITSVAAPLPEADIDTDIIFPARFSLLLDKAGLGKHRVFERRHRPDGTRTDFASNQPAFEGRKFSSRDASLAPDRAASKRCGRRRISASNA